MFNAPGLICGVGKHTATDMTNLSYPSTMFRESEGLSKAWPFRRWILPVPFQGMQEKQVK
jgi:hypothetical protein